MSFNLFLQYLLPKHILSRLVAKIANCRVSFVKNFLIRQYSRFYRVDMSDALEPDLLAYPTFNAFFTRDLNPNARPITDDKSKIISPVDGRIWQIGKVRDNRLIYAKGKDFTIEQLLADNKDADKFHNASFAVLYLAPYNYHRIHMPISGKLISMRYIPGDLFSVNPNIVNHIPDLFAKNERVVTTFDSELGKIAIILVGAIIVGSIETAWSGAVTPNKQENIICWNYDSQELNFGRGVEIGRFKLGSTVILLFPENTMRWDENLNPDTPIKMGQSLGEMTLLLRHSRAF